MMTKRARPPVIVISHEMWTTRFGADPAILGRTIRFEGARTYGGGRDACHLPLSA